MERDTKIVISGVVISFSIIGILMWYSLRTTAVLPPSKQVPAQPTNLRVMIAPNEVTMMILWDAPESGNPTSYKVYKDGVLVTPNGVKTTSISLSYDFLKPGTYLYTVSAINDSGEGLQSNPIRVEKS